MMRAVIVLAVHSCVSLAKELCEEFGMSVVVIT